ncbi:MAG: hypothetical protein ABH886_09085 [Candidatus Desantisbacteria bacterium]
MIIEIIFLAIAVWIVYKGLKVLNQGEKKLEQVINTLTSKT